MPNRIRGIRTSLPGNVLIGRKNRTGKGPAETLNARDLAQMLLATGTVPQFGQVGPLAAIPDGDLLANTTGGTAAPVAIALTAFLDYLFGNPAVKGDILYRDTSIWKKLSIGAAAKVLTVVSGLPAWATASGGSSGMLPLVTGETPGPIPIADANGQFIGVPI